MMEQKLNYMLNTKNRTSTLGALIQLLRPNHWSKNSILLIPLFFSGSLSISSTTDINSILETLIGIVCFSLIASSIYIINDYKDIESDRNHPTKKTRPLASGSVSRTSAILLCLLCSSCGISLAYLIEVKFLFILCLYFVLNLGYSLGLKNISILDIIIVSIGFVFRVKAGGAITNIYVSEWLTIMIFLLSLIMAIAKRRDDVLIKMNSGKDMRVASKAYNIEFLNLCLILISGVTIVAYLMYTISDDVINRLGTHRLYYTCLFVIAGIFRYLQIAFVENKTESPTDILYKDKFIQASILLWICSFYFIIYYPQIYSIVL